MNSDELDKTMKENKLYMDKNVTECQLPEKLKDICVDEGLSHEEKVENGDKHDDIIQDDLGIHKDCDKNTDLYSVTQEKPENPDTEIPDERPSSPSERKDCEENKRGTHEKVANESENMCEDDNKPSTDDSKSSEESNIHQTTDNCVGKTVSKIPNNDNMNPFVESNILQIADNCVGKMVLKIPNDDDMNSSMESNIHQTTDNCVGKTVSKIPNNPNHDMFSDNVNMLQHGGGESSFSMAGVVSGSISHRSDSSNTSIRSFAFPVLQTEWNSSPVRMVKVDQRQSRKQHRGWKQAFTCCGF